MRKIKLQIKLFIICFLFTVGFQSNLHPQLQPQEKEKVQLGTPIQLLPRDNSSFKGYPTTLTLEWKPVKEADSYDVEIDCLGCRQQGKWDSETGKVWKIGPAISKPKYTFIFAGHYQGRWRVRASKDFFNKGKWSSWRNFNFDTSGSKKTAIQACGIVLESLSKITGAAGDTLNMFGVWGSSPGEKIPCLKTKDKIIPLPLRIWSENMIKVRIPEGLLPGKYQVGVYCQNPQKGPTDSSGWLDFEIIKK
jgi:hypothetical protein